MAGRRHALTEGDQINSGATNEQLVSLLAGLHDLGIDPHPDELADALWLARWAPAEHPERVPGQDGTPADGPGAVGDGDRRTPNLPRPDVTPPQGTRIPGPSTAELAIPGPGARQEGAEGEAGADDEGAREGRDGQVRVPTAAALPEPLALQRALRPLRGYHAPVRSATAEAFDEAATADRAADTGVTVPVFRGSRRRAARVQFVMDVSTSMVVWEETLQELRQICERSGAFREVRVHYVRENAEGEAAFALSAAPDAQLHRPEELRDPTGHRLTFVLSDCAGPLWRAGKMQQLLYAWATTAPVAVVQPLPQRMWRRTHLPAIQGELVRGEGPAGRLKFRPAVGEAPGGHALPVPVLAPRPGPLRAWVRLVSGAKGQSLRTVAGWVHAQHPPSGAPRRADRAVAPADRVGAYRRAASPGAARLAVYLAAAPLVLPVMQLVQRAMLPDSGPEVLAEVMLGGLLRRSADVEGLIGYEFIDGVRRELLKQIAVSDAHLVLKHCSAYLESRYGRTARNFPALAAAYLAGEAQPPPPGRPGAIAEDGLRAFARVSADVLRRFGQTVPVVVDPAEVPDVEDMPAQLVRQARELVAQYTAKHAARDLDEAAALLRAAVAASVFLGKGTPGAELNTELLHAELGSLLYLRWQVRQTVEDLRGALEAFARTRPRNLTAALLRAWHAALVAVATEVEVAGVGTAALPDSVREQEHEPYRAQRLQMRLWQQALSCLRTAKPKRDPASRDDDSIYANALLTLRVMASWGADAAFGELLRSEHEGAGEWTSRTLSEAVFVARTWSSADEVARLEHCADLLLDRARHLLGQGEVRWQPEDRHREDGKRQAAEAVDAYRALIAALYRERGGEPLALPPSQAGPPSPGVLETEVPEAEAAEAEAEVPEAEEPGSEGSDVLADGLLADLLSGRDLDPPPGEDAAEDVAADLGVLVGAPAGVDADMDADMGVVVGPERLPAAQDTPGADEAGEAREALERRLASAFLGLSSALQLYGDGADAPESERLGVLRLALELSGDDRELRTLTLQHLAWALADAYTRTGNREHLVEEISAWWASLAGLEPDSDFYPYALKSLGDALIKAEEWDDAVRMMREAVDNTADSDPQLPGRRMSLGHALLTRYIVRGGQSDLHEADWMLGAAARSSEGSEVGAASWQLRAQVAEEQAQRGRSTARWNAAADYYRRAAENAEEAGRPEIRASSRHYRARVLERTAGPAHALAEYREAVRLYAELGLRDTPEATEAQAAVRRLTGGRA